MSRGKHGAYARHFLCPDCCFAIPTNHWRQHRRACARQSTCALCLDSFPCRKTSCPNVDKPLEIHPGAAPTPALLKNLKMKAKKRSDGKWHVEAPWLEDAVVAETWEDAYWLAVKAGASCG